MIPILEVWGAVILAHLIQTVMDVLHIKPDSIHTWNDSQILLSWLCSSYKRWQVFVAYRISEIQFILPIENWSRVNGKENPAGCASRGFLPAELLSHDLCWSCPLWLRNIEIPAHESISANEELLEERKTLKRLWGCIKNTFVFQVATYVCLRLVSSSKVNVRKEIHPFYKAMEFKPQHSA